jgi:CRISPR/Cas system-associated exonuclease Cas4 (RecB family)
MPTFSIHISDVLTFKQCRRRWDWASPLRAGLEPRKPYAPFFTGRMLHHVMEHGVAAQDNMEGVVEAFLADERAKMGDKLWAFEKESIDEQRSLVVGMAEHYQNWAHRQTGPFADSNLEFIELEQNFSVPLYNPRGAKSNRIILEGRFDGIVRRKDDGSIWIWEIKTCRSIPERERQLVNDEQATAYTYAARHIYGADKVGGIIYTLMRKKAPPFPAVLDNGFLSKNIQGHSVDSYFLAIKRHHGRNATREFVAQHYGDVLGKLFTKGDREEEYFKRVVVSRNEAEIATIMQDLWVVGLEMARPTPPIYYHAGWHCGYCLFREPCLAKNAGRDYQEMLRHDYQPKKTPAIEEPIETA